METTTALEKQRARDLAENIAARATKSLRSPHRSNSLISYLITDRISLSRKEMKELLSR